MKKLQHPEVRYELTDYCNAKCIMCPRDKHTRAHGVMETGKFIKSIDEVKLLGCERVVLTGFGEPLLDKTLEQKIFYASEQGLYTYIITNASGLTHDRIERLLTAGLDEIRISFYGMGSESYSAVMRGLNYERSKNNILDLRKTAKEWGHKLKIQLSYLVLPENEKDVDEFKSFWAQRVDAVEVWFPHNFGDGRDYRRRQGIKTTCGRPENGPLQIQWNGDVIPCCYDYNNNIVLGNAFEQPVLDILNGAKYQALRDAHKKREFHKFPYCDQCDQLLKHDDALIFSNRHQYKKSVAVRLSNTDLSELKIKKC